MTTQRARQSIVATRRRYEASRVGDLVVRLRALDFVNWITMFGAALLWSALPLVIVLSSLADERIDDDLSRHIGLNRQGAAIVNTLFRATPAHAVLPILTGLVFSLAGVIAVVSSLQVMYERIFGHEPRGWRHLGRWIVWTGALLVLLVLDAALSGPLKRAAGGASVDVLGAVVTTLFLWWTMHFLLGGRTPWRRLVRPALMTGGLWLVLAVFSSIYFSPVLISDSRTYGTIGVVFSLLTWFFLIGGVLILGAVAGATSPASHDAQHGSPPEHPGRP